uniref:NAD(P)/FAD-dependent oxidoreductase n=1 Tax=Candidatus Methanomethylicus mesodigestus TaxID=1867258 RepID=A0A7C3F151_9CREN
METARLVVVGGGPAGLVAAAEAAKAGAEVEVFEEDREVGLPDHCAGLVSSSGLEAITQSRSFVVGKIKGARIFSPDGRRYEAKGPGVKAFVIDRPKFDVEMLRAAERAGVRINLGTRWEGGSDGRVLIIAEGTKARVSRKMGLRPAASIPAAQVDVATNAFDGDMAEIHTGGWAPGFFAWVVPRGERARVGLASYRGVPLELLNRMLEKNQYISSKVRGARRSAPIFGKVVVGGPLRKAAGKEYIAIGDAGGFVKPTTGGGVVLGCLIARIAGRVAAEALEGKAALSSFEREWRKGFGRDFTAMKLAAKVFSNMREQEIEGALRCLDNEGLLGAAIGYDMDLQGAVVSKAARSGAVRYALLPLLRSIL